jgi:sortase A
LRWIERGAWVLGLSLILFHGGARVWLEHARAEGIEAHRQATSATTTRVAIAGQPGIGAVDQSLWSEKRIAAFAESLSSPGSPEGVLRIPSLHLEVPVYAGTSELNLNRGAGHIEGTAALTETGNAGIAGHRDGFFRVLKDIEIDRDIYLDVAGRSLRYRVVDIQIVTPVDSVVLAPTKVPSITLVTCYPFYFVGTAPERYIVRAELANDSASESSEI